GVGDAASRFQFVVEKLYAPQSRETYHHAAARAQDGPPIGKKSQMLAQLRKIFEVTKTPELQALALGAPAPSEPARLSLTDRRSGLHLSDMLNTRTPAQGAEGWQKTTGSSTSGLASLRGWVPKMSSLPGAGARTSKSSTEVSYGEVYYLAAHYSPGEDLLTAVASGTIQRLLAADKKRGLDPFVIGIVTALAAIQDAEFVHNRVRPRSVILRHKNTQLGVADRNKMEIPRGPRDRQTVE
ncbi:unnamed protein product, partial [Amoebophrya sp. A25]